MNESSYLTWYAFKKDLESLCEHPILNNLWLQIKPQTALPWNSSNMRAAYVTKESLKLDLKPSPNSIDILQGQRAGDDIPDNVDTHKSNQQWSIKIR